MYVTTIRHEDGERYGRELMEFLDCGTFNKAAWVAIRRFPAAKRELKRLRFRMSGLEKRLADLEAAYQAKAEAEARLNALMWEGEK